MPVLLAASTRGLPAQYNPFMTQLARTGDIILKQLTNEEREEILLDLVNRVQQSNFGLITHVLKTTVIASHLFKHTWHESVSLIELCL